MHRILQKTIYLLYDKTKTDNRIIHPILTDRFWTEKQRACF